jgi:Putative prokaryotic signal transducing protein
MGDFVTVLTMSYPQQLYIIKGRLESEGIECFLKDELTVQSNNLWSNAVGGVKLQVQKQDVEKAVTLLTELGYIKDQSTQPDNLFTIIDRKTASIPIIKNFNSANRIVAIILLLLILTAFSTYLIGKPSKRDMLIKQSWTVDKIYYKNKLVGPKTVGIDKLPDGREIDYSQIGESILFDDNSLIFPGINTKIINGTWELDGSNVVLKVDTLMNIIDGSYKLDITSEQLILTSPTTTIIAHEGR